MEFDASLDNLSAMLDFIKKQLLEKSADDQKIYHIELACEEAIVNTISHGMQDIKDGKITIECKFMCDNHFEVTLRDRGIAFNPLGIEIEHHELNRPPHERKIGGLGVFLMKKLTKCIDYERRGDENILKMAFSV